ncbi:glycosyltransferase [Bacillus sp. JJ634]
MNNNIKVMQIIPNLNLGGAEIMVENLSIKLKEDGYDVDVVSLYDNRSAITDRLEKQKISVIYLGKKLGFDLKIVFKLYNLFLKKKPDVIHTHLHALPYAIIAAIIARVPIRVHTLHSIATKEASNFKRKINRLFYKYFCVIPVAISPKVKESITNEYNFKDGQVPMIYNGINLNKCIPKTQFEAKSDKINIVHVGSFKEAKNHKGLIESFRIVHNRYPNTVLKLIGSGELEDAIKDKVKQLGLEDSVIFLGLKSNVYSYLNEADIFILPSLWEGMPISLIEAMATGLPIVATRVGGIPDMIEDNINGLLVNTNTEDISEALHKLIKDKDLRQRLGNAAKSTAKFFSAQDMAEEYAKLYKNMDSYRLDRYSK